MYKKILIYSIISCIIICIALFFANFRSSIKDFEVNKKVDNIVVGQNDVFKPVKLEGWGNAWYTLPEYDGDDMPADALVEATNIDFDIKKSIAPRLGNEILGTQSTSTNPIKSLYTANALDGRQLLVRTHSTVIEWWNSIDEDWDVLDTGYTTGQDFSFVDGMTSSDTATYTYFVNGKEAIRRFRVGFGTVSDATASTTSITLNSITGFDSADDVGFNTSGTITANSIDYTYSSINGWILQGMTGVPDLDDNEGVISTVETSGFTDAPTSSIALVIKDQRLYAAYNNSVFCSNIDDFQDFSFTAPRVASEGEISIFPEGGDKITGLAVRPGYVAVFKKNYIGSLEFKDYSENLSDIATINTVAREIDIGAVNQKSIVNKNFSVIFSNNDIGISELTRLESKDFDETINLAERIRPSIEDYTLTDTAVGIYKNRILQSARDDSSFNNVIVVYDFVRDRFTKFTGWNASSFAVYDDNIYYGDSITTNVYKAFATEYNDNDLPYVTSWLTKWYNFGEADRWKEIGYLWLSGWVTKNTSFDFTVYLDEGGDLISKTITISGTGNYVSSKTGEGFAINPFGLTNFSNIEGSGGNLLHFSGYISLDDLFGHKFRNIQFGGVSTEIDSNYRVSKIIPYINILSQGYCQDSESCWIY